MLKKIIQYELRLIGSLSFIVAIAALLSFDLDYPQLVAKTREAAAPTGMSYLDYCDGRPSELLRNTPEVSCLADYPGEFAFGIIILAVFLSFIALSLVGIGFFVSKRYFKRDNLIKYS